MTKRVKIPRKIEINLLYRSAKTCCVCRNRGNPIQIHHIDKNPSNNNEENLIVLCQNCHDDAHTKRELSKNLTPETLIEFKNKWEEEVKLKSSSSMTSDYNSNSISFISQAVWTYVNHQRIPEIMKRYGVSFDSILSNYLMGRGLLDHNDVPIFQKDVQAGDELVTIYDRFEWDDAQRIHAMYTKAVDDIILKSNPIEMGAVWTRKEFQSLVHPGTICYCKRGFYFNRGSCKNNEEDRIVHARSNKIEIRFMANTRHMYGASALYSSFCGSRFTAALMLAKSYSTENGVLTLHATPLAMGTGFLPSGGDTPHHLRYGWAKIGRH